ncbi:MAG: BadF/BadG/BcrA/BcrD ATPase family protein [Reyranellaceae bacterium]
MPQANPGTLFLGLDAGGTRCRARLEAADGTVLGNGLAGPANLTLGVAIAYRSIAAAIAQAYAAAGLGRAARRRTHAAFGVAGIEDAARAAALAAKPRGCASLGLHSDAVTACVGAHGGGDGGILILGTGSQGLVRRGRSRRRVGGWGFPISDHGSAAMVGQQALRHALLAQDGVGEATGLTRRIMRRFDGDPRRALVWARQATPAQWGELAPLVFGAARRGDAAAAALVAEAVADVVRLLDRMQALGARRIALVGGMAAAYAPLLPRRLKRVVVPAERDALAGALLLARQAASGGPR